MREIEFRGKKEILTEENKRYTDGWIYSDTLYKDDDGVYLIPYGVSAEAYHLGTYDFRANSDRFEIMVAKIKPETLGQYTGLTDKNGTKIFEGDIVRINGWWYVSGPAGYEKNMTVVKYDNEVCGFTPMCNYDTDCGVFHSAEECEVIGNVFDNPELLEGV